MTIKFVKSFSYQNHTTFPLLFSSFNTVYQTECNNFELTLRHFLKISLVLKMIDFT